MRLLSVTLCLATVLLSARPAFAAESDCAKPGAGPSLVGTRWAGRASWVDGDVYAWTLYLRADCVAQYSYKGKTYTNGRWLQRDQMLVLDANDFYSAYLGHLNGDELSGVMFNKVGLKGTWSFRRAD